MNIQVVCVKHKLSKQQGFTLIEVMISIVVAMVVLAGLMLTFSSQSSQYQYQNKRIDASQDLEFAIKFIARDLRSALVGDPAVVGLPVISIVDALADPYATLDLKFEVWDNKRTNDPKLKSVNGRYKRYYKYVPLNKMIRYDRSIPVISTREMLPNVTLFKVFDDSITPRGGYVGIPVAQPNTWVPDPANPAAPLLVPGYTILIEVEVPIGYKGGGKVNVKGVPTTTKRIWRYVQVYPMAAVKQ